MPTGMRRNAAFNQSYCTDRCIIRPPYGAFPILPKGVLPSDDFHVYSVEWSPKGCIFRMDGRETYRIAEGVSQVPQYFILSLLTADWEPRVSTAASCLTVRVWQADSPPQREFAGD